MLKVNDHKLSKYSHAAALYDWLDEMIVKADESNKYYYREMRDLVVLSINAVDDFDDESQLGELEEFLR